MRKHKEYETMINGKKCKVIEQWEEDSILKQYWDMLLSIWTNFFAVLWVVFLFVILPIGIIIVIISLITEIPMNLSCDYILCF